MQKYLQKELGIDNIRLSIKFLRIFTAHDFDMGNVGLKKIVNQIIYYLILIVLFLGAA